jgi:hypothetical protein
MPWFKVDDTFAMHEKVMAAGNSAIGLWTRAGAWSMQQLTDGFVPEHVLRALGTPKERRKLVEVSLWDEAEGGVTFRNWDERQPTKEQIEAARQAAAERQRHARERAKSRRESQRDATRDFAGSHGPPDPTRPDPTRSSYGTTPPSEGADKPPAARKRASALPDDFAPNDTNRRVAQEHDVSLDRVLPQFTDHHRAKGSVMKDWHAALNTWVRRENPDAPTGHVRRLPYAHELELPPDGLSPAEYAAWEREQRERRKRA